MTARATVEPEQPDSGDSHLQFDRIDFAAYSRQGTNKGGSIRTGYRFISFSTTTTDAITSSNSGGAPMIIPLIRV